MLDAEMHACLKEEREAGPGNHRNGPNLNRLLTESVAMEVAVQTDREGRFEPQLIEKYFTGPRRQGDILVHTQHRNGLGLSEEPGPLYKRSPSKSRFSN